MVFWISLTTDSAMCNEKRRALYDQAKTKSTESLAEYLFTHIVKCRVVIIKEVAHVAGNKKNPWFRSHILSKVFEQMGIGYKAIVRCKHLVAHILQHGFKLSSWLKVNKISNQIVHYQSATKFASMLQDIKKLQAWCKTAHTYCISDIAQKTTIPNILTMLTQTH